MARLLNRKRSMAFFLDYFFRNAATASPLGVTYAVQLV